MLNQEAIFVNGFSRGGTTILTNLLASHPDVCLIGETHHVFKGHRITDSPWRVISKCLRHDAPILVGHGQDFFSPRLIKPRKSLSQWAQKRIDRILYREKLRSQHPLLNRYKSADAEYTPDELLQARLLCKNIDGMVYANDAFAEMYPDATFLGLVRNGLAVCEGHLPPWATGRRDGIPIPGASRQDVGRCSDDAPVPDHAVRRFDLPATANTGFLVHPRGSRSVTTATVANAGSAHDGRAGKPSTQRHIRMERGVVGTRRLAGLFSARSGREPDQTTFAAGSRCVSETGRSRDGSTRLRNDGVADLVADPLAARDGSRPYATRCCAFHAEESRLRSVVRRSPGAPVRHPGLSGRRSHGMAKLVGNR